MSSSAVRLFLTGMVWLLTFYGPPPAAVSAEQVLLDFGGDFDVTAVQVRDVKLSRHERALRLGTGHNDDWPGITLGAPQGRWDLAAFEYVALDVANVGSNEVEISCRIDSSAGGARNNISGRISLKPGEKKTFRVTLRKKLPPELRSKLFGMRGYPGGWNERRGIAAANVSQLRIFVARPTADHVFEIANVRAGGSAPGWLTMDEGKLFPLIDPFGQFIHKDWPGKTKSIEDLAHRMQEEAADLARKIHMFYYENKSRESLKALAAAPVVPFAAPSAGQK